MVVLYTDHLFPIGVWNDAIDGRAVAADVVPAILSVIFDSENVDLFPEGRLTEPFDDPSKPQILIGHARGRSWRGGFCVAHRVLRKSNDHQIWKFALGLKLLEFTEKHAGGVVVGNCYFPADVVLWRNVTDRFNDGSAIEDDFVRLHPSSYNHTPVNRASPSTADHACNLPAS